MKRSRPANRAALRDFAVRKTERRGPFVVSQSRQPISLAIHLQSGPFAAH